MLILALIISGILLLTAHLAAIRVRWLLPVTTGVFLVCGVTLTIGPIVTGAFLLPPLIAQFVMLAVCLFSWHTSPPGRRPFWHLSGAVTLTSYSIPCLFALSSLAGDGDTQHSRLVETTEVPFESIEGRLPSRKPAPSNDPLPDAADRRLGEIEESIDRFPVVKRAPKELQSLHTKTVWTFINSQGFGIRRVLVSESSESAQALLALNQSYEFNYAHSQLPDSSTPTGGQIELKSLSEAEEADMNRLHIGSVLDFVRPGEFGTFKSRREVRDFKPHQSSRMPDSRRRWRVQSIELVSLLLHDEPVIYVSHRLPAMNEVREVPTRLLDAFETSRLGALRRGEDLSIGATADGVRMLGAIRSARQCIRCHEGERGDLLGAFSYAFSPSDVDR
jgi:hypothetical protein